MYFYYSTISKSYLMSLLLYSIDPSRELVYTNSRLYALTSLDSVTLVS